MLVALDHVQLTMPPGGEDRARRFYQDVLGLTEQTKPPVLAARGGFYTEDPFGNRLELLAPDAD